MWLGPPLGHWPLDLCERCPGLRQCVECYEYRGPCGQGTPKQWAPILDTHSSNLGFWFLAQSLLLFEKN